MSYHYRKHGDLFQLIDDDLNQVIAEGPEVSIAVSQEDGMLMRHGLPHKVEKWAVKMRARYLNAGLPEGIIVITSANWDPLELEKMLEIDTYMRHFLENHGVQLGTNPATIPYKGMRSCHGVKANGKVDRPLKRKKAVKLLHWEGQAAIAPGDAAIEESV